MKTIVNNETNVSHYLFPQTETVNIFADRIEVGNPIRFAIGDLNSSNSTLVQNVTEPDDWYGCKYTYTATEGWVAVPDWVDPRIPIEEESTSE